MEKALVKIIFGHKCEFIKDVNEYLNQYSNIRMGIRIIFEYSMVNNIIFSTVIRKSRKLMTSLLFKWPQQEFPSQVKYLIFDETILKNRLSYRIC